MDFVTGDGLMSALRFTIAYLAVIGVMVLCFRAVETHQGHPPTGGEPGS